LRIYQEDLKNLGYNLPEEFALLPPIILDDVSTFWAVRGSNNLLTPYTLDVYLMNLVDKKSKGLFSFSQ